MGTVTKINHSLTDLGKSKAILDMMNYCVVHGVPLPQNIHTSLSDKILASTHLWPFEAKVSYDPKETLEERRLVYLRGWIKEIVQNVTSTGVTIKKEWDAGYLNVTVANEDEHWQIEYSVKREAVCERKVIGKKTVEERVIPAHEEEEIEWVCNDKSLLADGDERDEGKEVS